MANQKAARRGPIVRGTKNVFADLRFPDAAERQVKLRLAHHVVQSLDRRKLSLAGAAEALGVSLAAVKALRGYKLGAYSIARLMGLVTALGDDLEIVVRRTPRSRRTGTISVAIVEGERTAFEQARRRALKRLGKGLNLHWSPSPERDDVHQR
ncbi:MAG: helix-turn-helix domain-containing protein [Gemmatimonadaceae bacterium]